MTMPLETHESAPANPLPPRVRLVLRIVKTGFLFIALCFLAWVIWKARTSLLELFARAQLQGLALAVLFGVAAHLFAPVCTVAALRAAGTDLRYRVALSVHLRNLPARYLPGGVWHTVGRAHDFLTGGMRKSELTALLILESAMPVGVGLALSCSLLLILAELGPERRLILAGGLVIGLLTLSLVPTLVGRVTATPVRRSFSANYLALIVIYMGAWLLLAGMFTSYLLAFGMVESISGLIQMCATYVFAWSVGFIAIFAPQGIGVFEVTAASFLPSELNLTTMVALVAGFRLIPVVTDLLAWGTYAASRALGQLIKLSR